MFDVGISSRLRDLILVNSQDLTKRFDQTKKSIRKLMKVKEDISKNIMDIHQKLKSLLEFSINTGDFQKLFTYLDKS